MEGKFPGVLYRRFFGNMAGGLTATRKSYEANHTLSTAASVRSENRRLRSVIHVTKWAHVFSQGAM